METYDCLYLLDSEKSKVDFFYHGLSWKKIPGHTRPKTSNHKNGKVAIFKANFRLVKIVIVQKSY